MALMTGSNRFEYDALLALRAYNLPAVSASGRTDSFDLHINGAYWGGYANEKTVNLVVDVRSLDLTTGDETYKFSVEVAADAAFTASKKEFSFDVAAPGVYSVALDVATLREIFPGADRFAVAYTLGGTSPSVEFAAYIAPLT